MPELLYHVDKSDHVLGSVDRDAAHRRMILHRSGVVVLQRPDKRVLIQHRSPEKKTFPDCMDHSCTFHVAFGEEYQEAAKRELFEETGTTKPIRYVGKFHHTDPPEDQMVAVFVSESDEPIKIAEEESTGYEFYTKEQVYAIIATGKTTPWFGPAWNIARDVI